MVIHTIALADQRPDPAPGKRCLHQRATRAMSRVGVFEQWSVQIRTIVAPVVGWFHWWRTYG
jgi:hypothetical protein